MSDRQPSGQGDVRGFVYALEPFVRQQEWRMEQIQNSLARVRQDLAEASRQRDALRDTLQGLAADMQRRLGQRPDPQEHRRGLEYLRQLQQEIAGRTAEIDRLDLRRGELQLAVVAQQRKLDGLDEHRAEELEVFVAEAARHAAAEADRDWVGRMPQRTPSTNAAVEAAA